MLGIQNLVRPTSCPPNSPRQGGSTHVIKDIGFCFNDQGPLYWPASVSYTPALFLQQGFCQTLLTSLPWPIMFQYWRLLARWYHWECASHNHSVPKGPFIIGAISVVRDTEVVLDRTESKSWPRFYSCVILGNSCNFLNTHKKDSNLSHDYIIK